MRKFYPSFILFFTTFLFSAAYSQQELTNTGKEFWVGYGHHQYMEIANDNSQIMTIYLATGDSAATVTIQIEGSGTALPPPSGGAWTRTYTIPANTAIAIDDPMPAGVTVTKSPTCISAIGGLPKGTTNDCGFDARLLSPAPPAGTGSEGLFTKKGIHITSTTPIVAYAHTYGGVSSGAAMLLPVNSWGYNYTSINSQQQNADNAYSWLFVVASQNNTKVEITPSVPTKSWQTGRSSIYNYFK